MTFAAEMKEKKQRFLREMYTIAQGRFGVLIDSYDIGEKHGFDWGTLETIVEYLEAKGLIASYEGTLYRRSRAHPLCKIGRIKKGINSLRTLTIWRRIP
jgi:arginyl-tRNA synthetase